MVRRYDVDITLRRSVDVTMVSGTTDVYTNGRQDYRIVEPTVTTTVSGTPNTEFII
jgi:hypothetical protein